MIERKLLWPVILLLATLCGVAATLLRAPIAPLGVCAYLVLTLSSGGALYLLAAREPTVLGLIVSATALSPVIVATLGAAFLLLGAPARLVAALLVALSGAAGVLGLHRAGSIRREPSLGRAQVVALVLLFVAVVAAIGYLPFTHDSWRMRADAWFHAAVIAQIADYGIPPEDPYAVGMPLQYMWFYHVYIYMVSIASGIGPFVVMALANCCALIGFGLTAFLFSVKLNPSFPHNYASAITAIFGMNAGFWVFLPLKLMRVFTGEVRGTEDAGRLLSLHPFDASQVRRFVRVGFNQEFLLDKFMIATAFSLGLCLMAVFWYYAARYLSEGRKGHLILAFTAAFGVMVIHTALGSVVFAGVAGGAFLLLVSARLRGGSSPRPPLALIGALIVCGLLLLPYLHSVSRAKGGEQVLPIGLSGPKMIGIVTSCALVIFLSAFQLKKLFRSRDLATRFLLLSTAAVLGVCALINLPAANSYDKLPFLVFFPLAVVGGWTIADFAARGAAPNRRRARFALAAFAAFAPLNLFMFAGYYASPPVYRVNADEKEIAAWIRNHTPRDAIIFDTNQRGFLLVTGPRRYFLGSEAYAEIWGYEKKEVARRKAVLKDLYSPGPLEKATLEALGGMPSPLFVIVRRNDPAVDALKFDTQPELFGHVFSSGPISVFEIRRDAFRSLAARDSKAD